MTIFENYLGTESSVYSQAWLIHVKWHRYKLELD